MTNDTLPPATTTADAPSAAAAGTVTATTSDTNTKTKSADAPPESPATQNGPSTGVHTDASTLDNANPSYLQHFMSDAERKKNAWNRHLDIALNGIKKNGGKLDDKSRYYLNLCLEHKETMETVMELEQKRKEGDWDNVQKLMQDIGAVEESKDKEDENLRLFKEWLRYVFINVLAYVILILWVWTIVRYSRKSHVHACGNRTRSDNENFLEAAEEAAATEEVCEEFYFGGLLAVHNVSSCLYDTRKFEERNTLKTYTMCILKIKRPHTNLLSLSLYFLLPSSQVTFGLVTAVTLDHIGNSAVNSEPDDSLYDRFDLIFQKYRKMLDQKYYDFQWRKITDWRKYTGIFALVKYLFSHFIIWCPYIYIGVWSICGMVCLIIGIRDTASPLYTTGQTWMGLAITTTYTYFGINDGKEDETEGEEQEEEIEIEFSPEDETALPSSQTLPTSQQMLSTPYDAVSNSDVIEISSKATEDLNPILEIPSFKRTMPDVDVESGDKKEDDAPDYFVTPMRG